MSGVEINLVISHHVGFILLRALTKINNFWEGHSPKVTREYIENGTCVCMIEKEEGFGRKTSEGPIKDLCLQFQNQ